MGAASDILGVPSARVRAIGKCAAGLYIVERRRSRLCRQLRRLAIVAAALCALAVAGCSYPARFVSPKTRRPSRPARSRRPADQSGRDASRRGPSEADLAYARAAAADAWRGGGKDKSVPWQNPQTGVGGNITPLATAYSEDGLPCRDFLASYVHGGVAGLAAGLGLPHRPRQLGSQASSRSSRAERLSSLAACSRFACRIA